MVLRITVIKPINIVKAIQAAAVVDCPMVILIWRPEGIWVQSMLTQKRGTGQNLSTLLRLAPLTFSSFETTDQYFNAVVELVDLEAVFFTAHNDEPIEFSRSVEDNLLNDLGYLHARFNRPVGAYKENYISLKIHGICSEKMLQSADISADPSLVPFLPLVAFNAHAFAQAIRLMENMTGTVHITIAKQKVFFAPVGKGLQPLILETRNGVIYTRQDVEQTPVQLEIQLPTLNIHPGAEVSIGTFLYKRTDNVAVLWFALDKKRFFLRGEILYYLY